METKHNQELNEIMFLIEYYLSEKKIDKTDLEEIVNFTTGLIVNKDILHPILERRYKLKFNKYFSKHKDLNKNFEINPLEIDLKKDLKLHLITYNGKFELATQKDGKIFYIENKSWKEITDKTLIELNQEFDKTFGEELDKNLKKLRGLDDNDPIKNTRQITIDYATNFNNINNDDLITFTPCIQHNATHINDYFSLIMKISSQSKAELVFYDTFSLCPPYPAGHTTC